MRRLRVPAALVALTSALACSAGELIAPAPETDPIATLLAQAIAFEHGEGVPKDPALAVALYCEAARAGNAEAQYSLGWMYVNGRGIERDQQKGAAMFTLAAKSGHVYAQRMVERIGTSDALPECMEPQKPLEFAALPFDRDPDPLAPLIDRHRTIAQLVTRVAPGYGIDPRLALAVIAVESNFEPRAQSIKNARGLMQLIPETAERFNVRNAFDVHDNVRGGLSYLRWLLAYYEGRVALAAAAYNAGEKAVDRYRGVPPYPETRDYVKRVLQLFRGESHPFDARVVAPSPMLVPTSLRAR